METDLHLLNQIFNDTKIQQSRNLQEDFQGYLDPDVGKGDPGAMVTNYLLDQAGSELGFFFFFILAVVFFLLNQVDGKIFRLKIFLMNRDFNLVQNDGFVIFVNFLLRMLSWISLILPFLSLAVWAAGLIIRAKDFNTEPIGGIAVILTGTAFMSFSFAILKLKWNNYSFKFINGLCLFIAFACFTSYQFIVVFLDTTSNSYFGYSTVFLNANLMIIILAIFLNSGLKGGSISDVIMNKLPKGDARDPDRDQDFLEEVNEERSNKSYFPSYSDIVDLFTISRVESESLDHMGSAFGGGIQTNFRNMNIKTQRLVTFFLWCCATGVLVIYAFVIYWKMDHSRLGFVTMIATLITDVFLYLIYNAKIVENPTFMCFGGMLNRVLLYVFGGNYWIYGYLVLYLIYGVMLSEIICRKRFPFEKAFDNVNLDNIQRQDQSYDVSKAPEFILAIVTIAYLILFVVLYVTEPLSVPLPRFEMDQWSYPYYIIGVFCLLLIATFFSLLSTYRLFIRKRKRIEPKQHFFVKNYKFDMYWIFIIISFVLLAAVGLIASWITDVISTFVIIIFVSIFVIFYMNVYLHYVMNDYEILQNIEQLNVKIRKHNDRLRDLKEKVVVIKKDLKDGKSTAIGKQSLGLAQSILIQDKIKKQQERQNKDINNANEQLKIQSAKTNSWMNMGGAPSLGTLSKYGSNKDTQRKQDFSKSEVNIKVQQSSVSKVQPTPTPSQPAQKQTATVRSSVQNDDDRLIAEEMAKGPAAAQDDIYEGGEEENIRHHNIDAELEEQDNERDIESSDEEFDLDLKEDNADEKRSKRRIKEIPDWRKEMNFVSAFFKSRLRANDYQIIISLLIAHAAIGLMAFLVSYIESSTVGVTIAVPMIHYTLAAFSLVKHLSTDAVISPIQYFFFFLAYAIQYGWGIAYLFIIYNQRELDPTLEGEATAGTYIVVYLMVIPFITSALSAAAKWYDDKGKFSLFFFIQAGLSALQIIGMLVLAYVYLTYIPGIIVSCVAGAIGYIILQVSIYVKNDYYMPRVWSIINILIVTSMIIACTVVSIIVDEFRTYFGVSISTWMLALMLLVFAGSELSSDLAKMESKPVFFSPWLFPVYSYNAKKNDVEPNNGPAIALISGILLLLVWSVTCTVWVYPHNIGVSIGILFEEFLLIFILHLAGVSSFQIKNITDEIDKKILRRAWLDAKIGYINNRSAMNREQLMTYEKITLRRDYFRNYMRLREGRDKLNAEEKNEGVKLIQKDQIDIEWIDENQVNLSSNPSCYSYLFQLEKDQNRIYQEELELIVQFQLLIVLNAENLQEQKKKYLLTFLQEKKAALFALGIVINIPDQGSMSVRYAQVITQIQKLSPEKQTIFNHLRDHFVQEQREVEERRKETARMEEEKERERQEMLGQLSEAKKKLLASISMDMPVDEMPDCEMKYKKILMEAEQGKVFKDAQFKPDDSSLGPNCLNRGVAKWVRGRDRQGTCLYKDKINHLDVVQGALGDCYFLSAISVLGEKYVKKIILTTEEEWKKTGCFMIQFYKNGDPETIIIDDFFPAYGNDDWSFVKGGDGDELWPMVLEKAYAKMYGNYNYIEAGKVQYALSDMTDGFPEQIDLKVEGKNLMKLWESIKTLKRHGALMGAGSPENALGDRAINELGIVQGHAYAVLDAQEVDGIKLMCLRNPHGSAGEEWNGDWGDSSEKWTQRMKNKLGYQEQKDGVFWMECIDFVQQYSYLYICRILDPDEGWKEVNLQDSWKGASAEGLPTRSNPNARLDFNPQYSITVTKPCDGFISLRQYDMVNMFKGKHAIFFMVSKVNGKRITKVDKTTMVAKSGNPINLNIMTAECDFDKTVTYPYKFTLMIANSEHGKDGEGDFEFSVYATDPNIKVEKLPLAKDFPQSGAKANEVE